MGRGPRTDGLYGTISFPGAVERMEALFLAPHGDDAHIAAAGTMVRLREGGAEMFLMSFCHADDALPKGFKPGTVFDEVRKAAAVVSLPEKNLVFHDFPNHNFPSRRQEILQILVDWRREHNPDLVFAPATADTHQDHATIAAEAIRAFRKSSSVYGFDMPWNVAGPSRLDLYVELSEPQLERKLRALACFKSQQGKKNSCATPEYARHLAAVRGNAIEVPYAEAFEVVREVRRQGRGLFQ